MTGCAQAYKIGGGMGWMKDHSNRRVTKAIGRYSQLVHKFGVEPPTIVKPNEFNDNQCKAIEWDDGPLMVVAGSGSGKTLVLTHRIVRLLEQSPRDNYKFLVLTFTNKTAAEIRRRITELLPNSEERIKVTTYHSFAADILRQHGHHINIKPDFTILPYYADRIAVMDDAILAISNGKINRSSSDILPLMTQLVDYNISPEQSIHFLEGKFSDTELLASIYATYRSLMIKSNMLDYPAIIAETLELFKKLPVLKKLIYTIYPYVCVDECQDINYAQYDVLRNIVNPETKNLFIVADKSQIDNQWDGTNSNLLQYLNSEFGINVMLLPDNYRCPIEIVECANKLISNSTAYFGNVGLPIASRPTKSTQVVRVEKFSDFNEEVKWIAEDIMKRKSKSPGSFVVFARTNRLLTTAVEALDRSGVGGLMGVQKLEFDSDPMKWLHNILHLANSRSNKEYLRIVCESFSAIEEVEFDVESIVSQASAENIDFLRAWRTEVLNTTNLSDAARSVVGISLVNLIDHLNYQTFSETALEWLDTIYSVSKFEQQLNEYDEEKKTWIELETDFIMSNQNLSLNSLLQQLDHRPKNSTPPESAVPCYTIHSSKGMEFDHVYLIGMVENHFPCWQAINKGEDSQEMVEERRNCYAAITRAQQTLSITHSEETKGSITEASRFLHEMELLE